VVAISHSNSPYITAYAWNSVTGFGAKFSDPASLPTGPSGSNSITFSQDGTVLVAGQTAAPFINPYVWGAGGFGARLSGSLAEAPFGLAFSNNDTILSAGHSSSMSAYSWSGVGVGGVLGASPLPGAQDIIVHKSGSPIIAALGFTPFIEAHPLSGAGIGPAFADPATLPGGTGKRMAFSKAGNLIAIAHANIPQLTVYPWTASGFGAKFPDPAVPIPAAGRGVAFVG
jgi:hypothetical protein